MRKKERWRAAVRQTDWQADISKNKQTDRQTVGRAETEREDGGGGGGGGGSDGI